MLSYTYDRYWWRALLIFCYPEGLNCDPLVQPWLQNSQVYLGQTKSSLHKIWRQCNTAPSNNILLSRGFKCRKVNWEASVIVSLFLSETWHRLEVPIRCCDSCQLASLVGKACDLDAGCFKLEQHHHGSIPTPGLRSTKDTQLRSCKLFLTPNNNSVFSIFTYRCSATTA